jgi:hypothetical protein
MRFIKSEYDNGHSLVIMEHLHGLFEGFARLHPDDANHASEYAGCAYAETRATIKALKYEHMLAKKDAETCRKFIKSCECYKNWDPESSTAKAAYRQLNRRIRKVNKLADEINNLMKGLEKSIWSRDITLKAIERKQTNQSKEVNS